MKKNYGSRNVRLGVDAPLKDMMRDPDTKIRIISKNTI